MNEQISYRKAVRAILISPNNKVLMMKILSPYTNKSFWITPGGGLENKESIDNAIKRELKEELGLTNFELGSLVWLREHTFTWEEKRICQNEEYYIVHTEEFKPIIADKIEAKFLQEFRWWSLKDIEKSEENFTPKTIVNIVNSYLEFGAPKEALKIEVLVD